MDFSPDRDQLLKKMFDAAQRGKFNLLARKYDYAFVFELWMQIIKIGAVQTYFCKWRWTPNMTVSEALDGLDAYYNGLENLLQMRLEIRQASPDGKHKE